MRIGIYDPYLDDLGGGEKYMMTGAAYLSRNHDVTVFWDNKEDLDKLKKRFSLNFDKLKIEKNIFSSKVGLLKRLTVTKNYDVIIFLTDGSVPFVSSKKLFLHVQQPLTGVSNSSWKNKLKLWRVTGIFYNSEFTKKFNQDIFGNVKSAVVYPPVEIIEKKGAKENIILHVGRFRVINVRSEDYKKQQLMVDIFKKLIDKGLKNWKFIIATSVNDENDRDFQKMLNSANGYPIEFLVNKTNKDLWDIYNKAKIYWHATGFGEDLKKHPEYAEHFGISTVEAMGAGAVPVVINAGGQREIVTDNENGFLWESLEELESKTKKLISDDAMFKKLSNNARKKAKDFSKEKFCEQISKLISG